MSGEDFIKFYYENKNKKGFVYLSQISKKFGFEMSNINQIIQTPYFIDKNGKNFLKYTFIPTELDAEILLSRLYGKLGFKSCKNFPVVDKSGENFIVSTDVLTKGTILADLFKGRVFSQNSNCFLKSEELTSGFDALSGDYSLDAIKLLLLLRGVDFVFYNADRHLNNFGYKVKEEKGKEVVTGIATFDYENSGSEYNRKFLSNALYYNNFNLGGEDDTTCLLNRKDMIESFKTNETANMFLPKNEFAEILGGIGVKKEAKILQEETGYTCNQKLIDAWDKSCYNTAEELSK